MRLLMLATLLPALMAAYDKCLRPVAQWVGVNQGHGRGGYYGAKYHAGSVFSAGYQSGDYAFHSNHIENGATGSHGTDPAAVVVMHATGAFDDPDPDTGVMAPSHKSQNGWDAVVTKVSGAGVYEGVFAVDTLPVDGKYDDTSLNSGWGGYSYITNLDDFAASGDNDNLVAMGSFRGKLTFPTAAGATPVTLENPKWKRYDGFLTKFNANTLEVVWATGEKIQRPSCNTNTDGTPDKECPEPTSYGGSVATTSEGHVVATSNYGDAAGGSTTNGRLLLFNGQTGANVWDKDFGAGNELYATETIGTKAYVVGTINGVGIDPFDTGTAKDYTESAVVAAIDVSAASPGATQWAVTFGKGIAASIVADPDGAHLYVAGQLNKAPKGEAYTIGACSLTGDYGGFLMKLKAADGECVWATDTAEVGTSYAGREHGLAVDAAGTFIYAVKSGNNARPFDKDHLVLPIGETDGFLAKFSAADGVGEWVEAIGGMGNDYITDVVTSPDGVLVSGYTKSKTIKFGDAEILNLQHTRKDPDGDGSGSEGEYAQFAMLIHSERQTVSCIQTCTDDRTNAVITPGFCLFGSICVAHDASPELLPCFKCQADGPQGTHGLEGPNFDNHCYWDGMCIAAGLTRPAYHRYSSDSICESCDPTQDTSAWSITKGFFKDEVFEKDHDCRWTTAGRGGYENGQNGTCAPNNYGILFTRNSQGCQTLPDVPMPTTKSPALTAALVNPSAGTELARITSAISAARSATSTAHSELVAAWYSADPSICKKVVIGNVAVDTTTAGPCENTPAAHADAMAAAFETNMHYGHSVARIKVQQALAILHDDFTKPSAPPTAPHADIKMDIVAHMLIPMYQGAIKAAYEMDTGGTAAARDAARDTGLAYWTTIHTNVPGFNAADKARLVALFGPSASGANNYCEVKAILHRNLPDGSMLQYGQKIHTAFGKKGRKNAAGNDIADGRHTTPATLPTVNAQHVPHKSAATLNDAGNPLGEFLDPVEAVHLQERDIGTLQGASTKECTYPPPAPPPVNEKKETSSWVGATVVLTLTASGSVSDYSDLKELTKKIATAAGLSSSLVTISVAAASVIITATINVPAALTAASVQTLLSSKLGTAATASAALGITVESDPTMIATEAQQESSDSSLTDGEIAGVAIGATVGGIVLLGLVGLILRSIMFKEAKPVFTCLEKAPAATAKSPA